MAEPITLPTPQSKLTNDDKPTQSLLELLQQIKDALDDHEARLDDHEARIVVLEP